ncbi:MAG TPA: nucleotide exchange factor GrpE [Acidimicrobiales bacterium]|jgi:molecular chaperone GrpE|nr:nucleotide exchange factor GrpE [Acidimicrobiales bacterium]
MAGSRPESTDRPQSTGPVPPGTPPAAATPEGTPTAAGPSPTGHPSTAPSPSGDVAAAEAAVEKDIDIARIARERDDYLDALKRLQADFENYKKRILKQQTEHLERAAEGLVEKLLPVLDTFDLAIAHGGEGLDQVQGQLIGALEKEGLERIDPVGKPFDPNESDAVAHEPGDGEPVVSEVMRTGYRFKGKLLRPAMVKVKG